MKEGSCLITRKTFKWFGHLLLLVLAGLGVTYAYLASQTGAPAVALGIFKSDSSRFLVFAHRGGAGILPENTITAFKHTAKMGVDVLELDVHATKDGVLVVLHDATVERTTNETGKISDMTLESVKKLDAAYRFSKDGGKTFPFRGKRIVIPTLLEVFAAFPNMNFNIEPKQVVPSITKLLCGLIQQRKMTDKIIVGSFQQAAVEEIRAECPEVATSGTPAEVVKFLMMYQTGIGESYTPPMQALQIPKSWGSLQVVTEGFISTAHELNVKVHVWTINDPGEMQRLIDMGVDGIMTDYPEKLFRLLGRKGYNQAHPEWQLPEHLSTESP
ncbi:MAG TPA: glycerophosphodiester phosphodiesterase [Bacteriovoracaceae bacterium]|nr:glycerophosphodiester phosphodiesterase [Bacteriovoracaceae bacterium]